MPTAPDSPELARPVKRGKRMSETEVLAERVAAVQVEGGRSVFSLGHGTVSTFLADPSTVEARPPRDERYKAAGAE
jgi:hypothetical protein